MIHTIQQIKQYPVVMLIYQAGSSGEFLAQALSESIPDIHCSHWHWENHNQMKYTDFFSRSFNCGTELLDETEIIRRVNQYIDTNEFEPYHWHIGLVHPMPKILDYVTKNFNHVPVIDIETTTPTSLYFKYLARFGKIKQYKNYYKNLSKKQILQAMNYQPAYSFDQHLKIEWENIILHDPQEMFNRIMNFLELEGNREKFAELVADYRQRNQQYLDQLWN